MTEDFQNELDAIQYPLWLNREEVQTIYEYLYDGHDDPVAMDILDKCELLDKRIKSEWRKLKKGVE